MSKKNKNKYKKAAYVRPHMRRNTKRAGTHMVKGHTRRIGVNSRKPETFKKVDRIRDIDYIEVDMSDSSIIGQHLPHTEKVKEIEAHLDFLSDYYSGEFNVEHIGDYVFRIESVDGNLDDLIEGDWRLEHVLNNLYEETGKIMTNIEGER